MSRDFDPYSLSSPRAYLSFMTIFLVIVAFLAFILNRQISEAFMSNPGLNGLIVFVALFGIVLLFGRVIRLFPEISWVNSFRTGDPDFETRSPVLLAPMASLLGNKVGEMALTPTTARSILESIGMRLEESREISRYLTGLLVFLGLLGTFWGLLQTVSSVGATIQNLNVGAGDANVIFEDLKAGLEAPLSGMGTAFSSSLFGLTGSLVLGFLDLQAGQAQNRFYTELEDWLSTVTDIDPEEPFLETPSTNTEQIQASIAQLQKTVEEGGNRASAQAMANLAEGIQGLVKHVRSEQQMMREWAEGQTAQQKRIEDLLSSISAAFDRAKE
ncbi:flagellar motor protein MotA [Roseibium limicola]|uniref:Flagellar motor protein MotA n=1 Tax=Roseibium limicola TaxID=2816037 RepID=A0A939EQQ7_9HYPH|nr:flagellar motor protein MotA [Roseibium limicola]MBO0346934.1 flagellar motor protein MotA [Roseibium limicola]